MTCIRLPRAGPCNGDGATLVIFVASQQSGEDAQNLLARLDSAFGNPVLFDCNQ